MGEKIFKIFCSKISFILTYDKSWVLNFSVNNGCLLNETVLMGKKIFKIFWSKTSFILTYDKNWVLDFSVNTGSRLTTSPR